MGNYLWHDYNAINVSQAWVAAGRLGMVTALLGLHGGAFALALALALLCWQQHAAAAR